MSGMLRQGTVERASISGGGGAVDSVNGQTGVVVLDTGDISSVVDSRYVTDAQLTVIGNTSGTNTGDVTVTDSSEIDFTLTGQDITAVIKASSIDESKLDASVNASLDLADSSVQPGDNVSDLTNNAGYITASSSDTLTNKTIDANGTGNSISNIETADIASGSKTGVDSDLVTGTAGTSGDLSIWNADGDLVDGPTPPSGAIVGTSDSQILTNKTIDADSNTITNIENADIKAAAAIAVNKLAALTASRAVVSDGSGFISPATTTATEIGYVNGVTSAIQTQINTRLKMPVYTSTWYYIGGLPGQASTATNTTPIVDDVTYAVACIALSPCVITALGARTSSSNASVGAAIKAGIYAADGTNGAPGTRLGHTATGVAVGDSATNTLVNWTLDAATAVDAGLFWVVFLQDSTTGVRWNMLSSSLPQSQYLGGSTTGLLAGSNITWGYTGTATYSTGLPSSFGTPTVNTTQGLAPACYYRIQ